MVLFCYYYNFYPTILIDLVNANERLKSQLELTDIIESNYNEAKISNDKLREEIETNSKLYSQLNNKFKELNNLYDNKIKDEIALQQQYDELIIEKDQFLKHYNETIIIKEELSNKASAEMENALAVNNNNYKLLYLNNYHFI